MVIVSFMVLFVYLNASGRETIAIGEKKYSDFATYKVSDAR